MFQSRISVFWCRKARGIVLPGRESGFRIGPIFRRFSTTAAEERICRRLDLYPTFVAGAENGIFGRYLRRRMTETAVLRVLGSVSYTHLAGRHKGKRTFREGKFAFADCAEQTALLRVAHFPKCVALAVICVFPEKVKIFERHQFLDVHQIDNPMPEICLLYTSRCV